MAGDYSPCNVILIKLSTWPVSQSSMMICIEPERETTT